MPIKKIPKHFFIAVIVAALFVLAVHWDWYQAIPFMHCEGFGCTGAGILIFAMGLIIPILFAITGFILNKERRLGAGLTYGGASLLCMLGAFLALFILNQINIAKSYEADRQACAQYPQLCRNTDKNPSAAQNLAPPQQ